AARRAWGAAGAPRYAHLGPSPSRRRGELGRTRDFPAGARGAGPEPGAHGIAGHRHDNRDRLRGLLGSEGARSARCHDRVHLDSDQIGNESGKAIVPSPCPPVLDDDVLTLGVAELVEALAESGQEIFFKGRRRVAEVSKTRDARLLRLGHERRGEDTPTTYGDERSAVHHRMISSARTRRDRGMVRPRAFAVFRLITSSNFVGCSTGSSAGLA